MDSDNGLEAGANVLLARSNQMHNIKYPINRAYLDIIHMLRKWQFSWLLFMINIFCKFYLLSR